MGRVKKMAKGLLVWNRDRIYQKNRKMRKGTYGEWIALHEKEIVRTGKKENLVYLFWNLENGCPSEYLEDVCSAFFEENKEVQIAYGDEDVLLETPFFKPEWSPDLYRCSFYFGSVVVMRKELYDKVKTSRGADEKDDFCGFVDACIVEAGGFEPACRTIGHIPEILFHNNREDGKKAFSMFLPKEERTKAYLEELKNGFEQGLCASAKEAGEVALSVIIPSKDHPELLKNCIDSVADAACGRIPFEVILVDNGSSEENRKKINQLLDEYSLRDVKLKYLYEKAEFNFSHMCNMGAGLAKGSLLLFLNDDVQLCGRESLLHLAALASQRHAGAVGIKLFYPDSLRIQHAGITNLFLGPVHKLQFMQDDGTYYNEMNKGVRNFLAVTAACLMVERGRFEGVGGFSESLKVAFNDVDLCFKLYEKGYFNICDNQDFAYHHESLSRGDDESPQKLERLWRERDLLYQFHPLLEGADPYFPKGLSRDVGGTDVYPEYETFRNVLQVCGTVNLKEKDLSGYREDPCLLFRTEWDRNSCFCGYGVVLGDDNACYEKELLFQKEGEDGKFYSVKAEGQYRPELEKNMKDQCNVELCGFHVRLEGENAERFKLVGMAARSVVGGIRLFRLRAK